MNQTETLKVYELAKELGIDSISLVDKLRGLKIEVKNHMSDLSPEQVASARTTLGKTSTKNGIEKKSKSNDVVRKRSSATAASGATSAGAATPAATPTPTVVKKTAPSKTTAAKTQAAPVPVKQAALTPVAKEDPLDTSTVIRRRVRADGATETTFTTSTAEISAKENAREAKNYTPVFDAPVIETPKEIPVVEKYEAPTPQPEEIDAAPSAPALESESPENRHTPYAKAPLEDAITTVEKSVTADKTTVRVKTITPARAILKMAAVEARPVFKPVSMPSATPAAEVKKPAPVASGLKMGTTGGVRTISFSRPGAAPTTGAPSFRTTRPSGGIAGFTRPGAAPAYPEFDPKSLTGGAKGRIKGTTQQQDKDGFRIVKVTKENLDQMVEEESKGKRGVKGEEFVKPEDVNFADYRKKEMVFLPKKKRIPVGKHLGHTEITKSAAHKRVVEIDETISVQDLANAMSVKGIDVVKKLMGMGQMVTLNQSIDFDTASLIVGEYDYEAKNVAFDEKTLIEKDLETLDESALPRPPVVTIMGHVDHGKTTLLDSIREANVAGGEAGGITQHIGAYTVTKNGKMITFIDTPGHEAFTSMRARGADVTDIVILVVAADDGVMPQTREAINHARAAEVPIIVAVNKIDKPGANPEKIKQALAELNLLAEDWGGDTMFVGVSALKKTNLDQLLESILLIAEVQDYKASVDGLATGNVLEARLEKGRGPVATVLLKRGILKIGDPVVSGMFSGKVRAMTDHLGRQVKELKPGMAAEILGLSGVASAGEDFYVAKNERDAEEVATQRMNAQRQKLTATPDKMSLEQLFAKVQTGDLKDLKIILKADVFGSVEAVRESLLKLSTEKVKVSVIHQGAGGITESDVLLASASNAIIIGFGVRPETKARQLAEAEHVEIKSYSIIYELIDDVKKAMAGLLEKKKVEKYLGRAEVRQVFQISKVGAIAGTFVVDGKINRNAQARLLRDSKVIFEGKLSGLKRFKDDAKEVAQGYECGVSLEGFNDMKPGDLIEVFEVEMVAQEL